MNILIRVVIFQALWFLFAYWGQLPHHWLVPLIAIIAVLLDWKLSKSTLPLKSLMIFILILIISGLLVDGILFGSQLLNKPNHHGPLSPLNMWGFWIIFAPYYDFAFEKFYQKLWLAVLFAGIGGPLAYRGGAALAGFTIEPMGFALISILWMIFFPLSLKLYFEKIQT